MFEEALASFVAGCHKIALTSYKPEQISFSIERGSKYVRIVSSTFGQKGVFCFVNINNGDVLKAATWKAPAKHARGNIYDECNGLKNIGPYGPAYLR